jgi:hypothetical protein
MNTFKESSEPCSVTFQKKSRLKAPRPRVTRGDSGSFAPPPPQPPWPPFLPSPTSRRWQRDGVPPFSRSSYNRVLLGLGFTRRRCSAVELGFAGGAWFLCGLVFLAALAMRKRRRCRGIISPSFFCSPMAIYSDVNGEAGETCPGVEGRRIVFFFR